MNTIYFLDGLLWRWNQSRLVVGTRRRRTTAKLSFEQETARNQWLSMLQLGVVPTYQRNCPVCGHAESHQFANEDRYGLPIQMAICENCPTMYNRQTPDRRGLSIFYVEIYRRLHSPQSVENLYWEQSVSSVTLWNDAAALAKKFDLRIQQVLDVGSGSGGLLEEFKVHGAVTHLLDPNSKHLTFAASRGHVTHAGLLEDSDFSEAFDIVIARDVLEHALNPRDFIATIHRALKVNGIAYVQVPVVDGLAELGYRDSFRRYLQYAHLTNFTTQSLRFMICSMGFEVISTPRVGALWIRKLSVAPKPDALLATSNLTLLQAIRRTYRRQILSEAKFQVIRFVVAPIRKRLAMAK